MRLRLFLSLFVVLIGVMPGWAQQDGLLQLNDPLHRFLHRQQVLGRIPDAFLSHQPLSAYEAQRYLGTLDWIVDRQADWRHGEWHSEIAPNGRPLGEKASGWKTPYHNGRAMLQCLDMLASAPQARDGR